MDNPATERKIKSWYSDAVGGSGKKGGERMRRERDEEEGREGERVKGRREGVSHQSSEEKSHARRKRTRNGERVERAKRENRRWRRKGEEKRIEGEG